jgi:tetratricopeptide (TPR) repeat protein
LKGKDEPIAAYRLLGVSHRRSGLRESVLGHTTTFIDRHSELAILNSFLCQVESGRSQAVGIVGEPGIGKSRLVAEFHRQLAGGRVTWVEGRCVSYGTAIPYWLLLDMLRSNCGIVEADTPEAIVEKVRAGLQEVGMDPEGDSPVLLHLLGVNAVGDSPALSNPEAVKARAFETFHQLSVKGSRLRPLVLALDDLHWVDKISEEFLELLSENASDARILILATYRPGYHPPWIDKSYGGQAPVQPLSRDDSLQMVRSVLSAESLVDLVTEEIVTKADGNPLFLEQLALHAGENLRSALMVPDSIHDVVMARIDRLPDETKQLLQAAAVIGREFSLRLLTAVWKGSGSLEAQLRELTRFDFISERIEPEGTAYVFRHALTQEAAYGTLLERHRRFLHGAIGHALEKLYTGRAEEVAELLAFHFGRSEDAEQAVDFAILAAEKAQRRWANNEALNYFEDALRRLDGMPDAEPNRLRRIDAVLKQAEVKYALGQYTEQLSALQQIHSVIDETADPPRKAAWHYWTGFLHATSVGLPDVAIEHCRDAAKIASASGLEEINARAQSCLAQVYAVAGRFHEAIEAGENALSSFEDRGDLWWAARTLWFLSIAATALGQWKLSIAYCRRGLEYSIAIDEVRFKSVQAVAWWRMGSTYIQQGDLERGIDCCNKALALAPIQRDAVMAKAACAYADIKAGRVDAGIASLNEALGGAPSSQTRLFYLLWLAEGHLRRGDRAAARPLIDHALETSRAMGYPQLEGRACWLMSECLAPETSASSEHYVEVAISLFKLMDARNDLARAMVSQAALRQRVGDSATARQLLNQARVIFEELDTRDEPPRVEAALAALDCGLPIRFL